ncbi:MAG: hypothetical protein QXT13_07755 [Pyrobaculum sp.]
MELLGLTVDRKYFVYYNGDLDALTFKSIDSNKTVVVPVSLMKGIRFNGELVYVTAEEIENARKLVMKKLPSFIFR